MNIIWKINNFSARVDGRRETIELKLPELNIEQSRGLKKPTNAAPRQNT
jgi:hypothetical protein